MIGIMIAIIITLTGSEEIMAAEGTGKSLKVCNISINSNNSNYNN